MQPDDLAFAVNVELVIVARSAIDLINVANVRLTLAQRIGEARVEVSGEHRADDATHHEIGKNLVSVAYAICGPHQVKQDALAEFGWNKQVLDNEGKVFGKAVSSWDKPVETPQPRFPLRRLYALGRALVLKFALGVNEAGNLLDCIRSHWDTGTK